VNLPAYVNQPASPKPDLQLPNGNMQWNSEGMTYQQWLVGMLLQGQASFEGMEGCDPEQWAGCANQVAEAAIKYAHRRLI
jgi:hypothetical protein